MEERGLFSLRLYRYFRESVSVQANVTFSVIEFNQFYHVYTHGFFSSPLLLDLSTEQGKALKNAARLTRHGQYDFRC